MTGAPHDRSTADQQHALRAAPSTGDALADRLRAAFEQSPTSTVVLDAAGRPIAVNSAFERLWSAALADVPPEYTMLADAQLEAAGVLPAVHRAFAGEAVTLPPLRYEMASTTGRGRDLWTQGHLNPVRGPSGAVEHVVLTHQDVTSWREAEEALAAAAARAERQHALSAALATASTVGEVATAVVAHAAAVLGAVGIVIARLTNDGAALEIVRAGAMPDDVREAWHSFPIDAPVPLADVARTGEPVFLASRAEWSARYPQLMPTVEAVGHHANAVLPLVVDGRVLGVLGAAYDAPREFGDADRALALAVALQCAQSLERARLYEAEREARQWLDTVLAQLPVGVVIVKAPGGRVLGVNAAVERIWGGERPLTPSVEAYSIDWTGFHADGRRVASEEWPIARALRHGVVVPYEAIEVERADGTRGVVELSAAPVHDAAGRVTAAVAVIADATTRVRAEREREALLRALDVERARLAYVFQRAPAFLAVTRGPDHVFDLVNDAYYQLVGHRALIGRPVGAALPELRLQGFVGLLDGVLATGEPFVGREVGVRLRRSPDAPEEERFVDFVYLPLVEADGTRSGIIAHGTDVTDQVRARRDVERLLGESERARAEAEAAWTAAAAANQAKAQFLAVMSHELRTPLNAIGGYAELLELGLRGAVTAEQRQDLTRIRHSQRHLLGLINDVLNYARLETGSVHYETDDVPLAEALAAAEALVAPQASAKGLALVIDACPPGLAARADGEKLRQVLVNLLSNAVKFTDPGGRVTLSCRADGDVVCVEVRDTGVGIPADKLDAIFEPFVQVRAGLTRTTDGTGLGLAISRDLAVGMGGDLSVRSALGEGSTFTLTLPGAG